MKLSFATVSPLNRYHLSYSNKGRYYSIRVPLQTFTCERIMNRIAIAVIWIHPLVLIIIATYTLTTLNRLVLSDSSEQTQARLATILGEVESGRVTLSKEKIAAILKIKLKVATARTNLDKHIERAWRSVGELLLWLGISQLAIVAFFLRERKRLIHFADHAI